MLKLLSPTPLNLKHIVMKTLLHKALFLFLTATMLVSCNNGTQTVKVDGKYSIELPKYLEKTSDINPEASLQYQNVVKQFFVIVIDEPKTEFENALQEHSLYDMYSNDLEGYSKLITDSMDKSIKLKKKPEFENTTINGKTARLLSFEGLNSGYPVYWKLAFVEGNSHYYQIMVWTKAESKDKYEKEMTAIINSFKETDKSKN